MYFPSYAYLASGMQVSLAMLNEPTFVTGYS